MACVILYHILAGPATPGGAREPLRLRDTAVFIYFVEEEPLCRPGIEPVFEAFDPGELPALTSGQTLLETLVVPLRAGDRPLAERYEALLTRSRGLRMIELDSALQILQLFDYA